MSSDQIRIERVKVKDLPAFAASMIDGAAPGSYIPITQQRADAQACNPCADPDDVGLLVAWDGNQCVGYFGILPVMLAHEGQLHKVYWFTTWSVHESMLGQGLGSVLMANALELGLDFAIVGSAPARHVSAKFGFSEVAPLDYARIDFGIAGDYNPVSMLLRLLRKLLSLIGIKLNIERAHRFFARIFDLILGWAVKPWLHVWALRPHRAQLDAITVQRVEQVAPPGSEEPGPERTGFYRDSHIVNWMLAFPWVLPAGTSPSEGLEYAFTDARPGFEQIAWQLADSQGNDLGYLVCQLSKIREERVLKLLDYDLAESAKNLLLPLALRLAHKVKADAVEGPVPLAALEGSGWLGRLLVEGRQRICQVYAVSADSPMGRAWRQIEQTYVDGDTAFT